MVNINTSLNAEARGWGSGWPHCQSGKWVPLEIESLRGGIVKFPNHRIENGKYIEEVGLPGGVRPEILELVQLLLHESERRGYINLHAGWCWGAACRAIKTSTGGSTTTPSNHSWALAIDLNAPENGFGSSTHKIQQPMASLWNRYGFRWGGNYGSTKDWMHFEFMGTPADAKAMTEKARKEIGGGDELTPEQEKTMKAMKEFLDAVTEGLKPGPADATAGGAGDRVAAVVRKVEKEAEPTP